MLHLSHTSHSFLLPKADHIIFLKSNCNTYVSCKLINISSFYFPSSLPNISLPYQAKKDKGGGGGAKELNPWPAFIQERLDLWDRLKKESDEALAAKVPEPIQVRRWM